MWFSLAHAAENSPPDTAQTLAAPQAPVFSWSGYLEAVGLLFLLLAVLWLVLWCMRRFGKFSFLPRPGALPRDALVMEAQMPLGPRKGLMVVRFLNRRLLLGVTEHQVSLLTESPIDEIPDGVPENTKTDDVAHEHADFQARFEDAKQQMAIATPAASASGPSA